MTSKKPENSKQTVDAVIPRSKEMEVRKELPDLFYNPQVRIRVVDDAVFQALIDKGVPYGQKEKD